MAKFSRGIFIPKNLEKYIGSNIRNITYRSSWEHAVMVTLDTSPSVIHWASESIPIKYVNPLTNKTSSYIPDFFVIYLDKNGQQHVEIIEIKPAREVPGFNDGRISTKTRLAQAVNAAKWKAAMIYCLKRKWKFRIMTEHDIFQTRKTKKI